MPYPSGIDPRRSQGALNLRLPDGERGEGSGPYCGVDDVGDCVSAASRCLRERFFGGMTEVVENEGDRWG